jgi:hypothetical protein
MRETLSRRPVPRIVHDVLRSPGKPLDAASRASFEPRFQHDFSNVRVHSGAREQQSAMAVGALAYAAGDHVVLGNPSLPPGVLAHELAHVAQHRGGGDALPQRIAPANAPAEIDADRGTSHVQHDGSALHLYRPRGAFSSEQMDDPDSGLFESAFKDPKTQPWIETIDILFNGTTQGTTDTGTETIPTGEVTATYFPNPAALSPVRMAISGGSPRFDLTHIVKNRKVTRIEGLGYNDVPFAEGEGMGPRNKYAVGDWTDPVNPVFNASMHYAIFFKAGQALHGGNLKVGSHACVHAENFDALRQINYHTVKGRTVVNVDYTSSALNPVCCELFAKKKIKQRGKAAQPCNKLSPKACGAGAAP